ncbi:MAG: type II toxin-antitoxin system Phd/YefM family antitoxin, partial [Alphaproteobacteria bacterium]|nr:type II toxin-antitoxin system Phd/YefM family antitoxin [Alphaproteobacteria bacterium]
RRVVKLEEFTAEEIALIAQAEVAPGLEHLDEELKDWQP